MDTSIYFVLSVVYGLFLYKLNNIVWGDELPYYVRQGKSSKSKVVYQIWYIYFALWLVYFFLFGRFSYMFMIGE